MFNALMLALVEQRLHENTLNASKIHLIIQKINKSEMSNCVLAIKL